jgi:hypothetical protein
MLICSVVAALSTRARDLGVAELSARRAQRKLQVLPHGQARIKRVLLQHQRHVALGRRPAADVLPSISDRPAVGFSSPAIIRSVVVLPAPVRPSSTKNSPSSTTRSGPAGALRSAEALLIPFSSIRAIRQSSAAPCRIAGVKEMRPRRVEPDPDTLAVADKAGSTRARSVALPQPDVDDVMRPQRFDVCRRDGFDKPRFRRMAQKHRLRADAQLDRALARQVPDMPARHRNWNPAPRPKESHRRPRTALDCHVDTFITGLTRRTARRTGWRAVVDLLGRADLLQHPACITTIRSASDIASIWSCVT